MSEIFFIGDFGQLPPIGDEMIFNRNKLDGRPQIAPNHWAENFKMFFLTEKMRSHADVAFSEVCDRVSCNKLTEEDETYLKSRVKDTDEENNNENFKTGKISIIVTTNKKREYINNKKLEELLPNEESYTCNAINNMTNVPMTEGLERDNLVFLERSGKIPQELTLKKHAPIMITTNHRKSIYKGHSNHRRIVGLSGPINQISNLF